MMNSEDVASVHRAVLDSIEVQKRVAADPQLLASAARVARTIESALRAGGKVMLAGNGGSAADSQHLAAELVGRFERDRSALAAIALTSDTAMLTAIANDYGYEAVFARQVEAIGRPGDVFVAISTSGNSKNLLRAVESCQRIGIVTVALCGAGGTLQQVCDQVLAMPSNHTARIQESHILIGHAICMLIEQGVGREDREPG